LTYKWSKRRIWFWFIQKCDLSLSDIAWTSQSSGEPNLFADLNWDLGQNNWYPLKDELQKGIRLEWMLISGRIRSLWNDTTFSLFLSSYVKVLTFINGDMRNRRNMGIIGDESNVDAGCAPFLLQYFHQVIHPISNENIIP
jgi:hypothetical protein